MYEYLEELPPLGLILWTLHPSLFYMLKFEIFDYVLDEYQLILQSSIEGLWRLVIM
jgi:hypothetical protein